MCLTEAEPTIAYGFDKPMRFLWEGVGAGVRGGALQKQTSRAFYTSSICMF